MGAHLFVMAGLAALFGTLMGSYAGTPRLLADSARLVIPGVARFPWKTQFRFVLIVNLVANTIGAIGVSVFGYQPVVMVKMGAILDGLLLTPLQAVSVGVVLYLVMPKFFSEEVRRVLRTGPILAVGLALAFLLFGYVCVFNAPKELAALVRIVTGR